MSIESGGSETAEVKTQLEEATTKATKAEEDLKASQAVSLHFFPRY
jgi:hypothetical protein